MGSPVSPFPLAPKALSPGTLVLIGGLAVLLVAGYVTLAALGRDTTGYAIFLGGPAVTSVLGLVLNHRVSTVAAAVDATQAQTTVVVAESVSAIDTHLAAQDQTLGEIHAGVLGDPVPPPPPSPLPEPRSAIFDPSAPVSLFRPSGRPR